jgi:hypothetical protein
LPSCQLPSKKVQVCEKLTGAVVRAIIAIQAAAARYRHNDATIDPNF